MLASMAPAGSANSQEGGTNPGPGRGIWHPINPATALRTLRPTLGFLSETRDVYEPSSSMPMATHPAHNCMPTHELAETPARLGSLCHLPVVTLHEYHCPSTGLCSRAPGFQSALREADRGQAVRGRLPCLTPTSSLPRA